MSFELHVNTWLHNVAYLYDHYKQKQKNVNNLITYYLESFLVVVIIFWVF